MRYTTGAAFRAALDDRLPLVARTTGLPLDRIRKAVAFERFLARLTIVAPNRWCLKGGLALNVRSGSYIRPTKDIDIGHFADLGQARRDFVAAQGVIPPEGDHFRFQVMSSARLPDPNAGGSIRFQLEASMAGRVFDQASVDVAFEPDLMGRADTLALPTLLEFADLRPVSLQVVPMERHLADKIDAYLRGRINTRALSSREKDLVDMVMIAGFQGLVAGRLRSELEIVANPTTGPLPSQLPEPPISWGHDIECWPSSSDSVRSRWLKVFGECRSSWTQSWVAICQAPRSGPRQKCNGGCLRRGSRVMRGRDWNPRWTGSRSEPEIRRPDPRSDPWHSPDDGRRWQGRSGGRPASVPAAELVDHEFNAHIEMQLADRWPIVVQMPVDVEAPGGSLRRQRPG